MLGSDHFSSTGSITWSTTVYGATNPCGRVPRVTGISSTWTLYRNLRSRRLKQITAFGVKNKSGGRFGAHGYASGSLGMFNTGPGYSKVCENETGGCKGCWCTRNVCYLRYNVTPSTFVTLIYFQLVSFIDQILNCGHPFLVQGLRGQCIVRRSLVFITWSEECNTFPAKY